MSLGGGSGVHPGLLTDTTRANLSACWVERVEEADQLLNSGYRSMGVCLKVYALEARVKLRICDHLGLALLPKACKTHDLSELLIFTGLWQELQDPANELIFDSWDVVSGFSKRMLNNLRYEPRANLADATTDQLIEAMDDPTRGVFAWLSRPR